MELIIAFLEHPKRLQMNLVSRICYVQYVPLAYTFYPHKSLKKQINAMLISLPNGAGEKEIERWMATNRMSVEKFKACWQTVSPDLHFPGTIASDDITYTEWAGKNEYGDACKFQGMWNAAGLKSGIVRMIGPDFIVEATYFEDK